MSTSVRCHRCHTRVSRYAAVCHQCGVKSPGEKKKRRALMRVLLSPFQGSRVGGAARRKAA